MCSKSAKLIAVDWGTSNRRAFLLDGSGSIIDTHYDTLGLSNNSKKNFHKAYSNLIIKWEEVAGDLPTLMSGMVGASTGWIEAPYCELPAGIDSLATNLKEVPTEKNVWIIPGIKTYDNNKTPDVIRGEEIQAISASEKFNDTLIIAPGTHSKWIKIKDGKIIWFSTFMTGDLHKAILNHTVISALNEPIEGIQYRAFLDGVRNGLTQSNNLSHILFGARTKVLFEELKSKDVSDYLSGLLLGAEISSGLAGFQKNPVMAVLIGNKALCSRYIKALKICKIKTTLIETTTIVKAYIKVARFAGLIKDQID